MGLSANDSDNVAAMLEKQSVAVISIKTVIFVVILLVSFVGNATLSAVIYKNANRRMRTISNLFIANMAISNLSLVVWNVPFSLSTLLNEGQWFVGGIFGRGLCKFCMFVWFLSELLSSGSLSAIAVDRFLLVFFPTKQVLSKRVAFACLGFSWAFAIGFSFPVFYYTETFHVQGKLYCFMNFFLHKSITEYMVIAFSIFIATPITVLSCLYTAIILKLLGQKTVGENVSSERKEKKRKENYRICILLLVNVIVFAVCVLPFWVSNTYCFQTLNWNSWMCSMSYIDASFILTIVNAGVNPFIYLLFSQAFRNGAKHLFFKVPLSPEDDSSLKSQSRKRTNRVEPRQSVTAL